MGMEKWLDMGAAALALVAAAFWFLSAYGKLPPMGTYVGTSSSVDPFYQAVRFSAEMNRWAAGFSGVSALCIGVKLFHPVGRVSLRSVSEIKIASKKS
jgi:hypothetical protein